MVADTPASALGSTRDKPDAKYCQEIFKVLKAHETALLLHRRQRFRRHRAHRQRGGARRPTSAARFHIPKTIDNDLLGNDHAPGFRSAARFVAQAFMGDNLDNLALPGVYIAVVMGRHAGFLTAASALAREYPDDGPHLIYVPERRSRSTSSSPT